LIVDVSPQVDSASLFLFFVAGEIEWKHVGLPALEGPPAAISIYLNVLKVS
jgi:hypothetical protein